MDLSQALHVCRLGATIRDDGGTMKPGWKVEFVPDDTKDNLAKSKLDRLGIFRYINPKGEDAHQLFFKSEHRASVAWNVVDMPPEEKKEKVK